MMLGSQKYFLLHDVVRPSLSVVSIILVLFLF